MAEPIRGINRHRLARQPTYELTFLRVYMHMYVSINVRVWVATAPSVCSLVGSFKVFRLFFVALICFFVHHDRFVLWLVASFRSH